MESNLAVCLVSRSTTRIRGGGDGSDKETSATGPFEYQVPTGAVGGEAIS